MTAASQINSTTNLKAVGRHQGLQFQLPFKRITDEREKQEQELMQTQPRWQWKNGVRFPYVKNRRVFNPNYKEIAFYPEAIALIHDLYPDWILTQEECKRLLKKKGFPHMNQGNWTNARDQGLITELKVKRYSKEHPTGVLQYVTTEAGSHLNEIADQTAKWAFQDCGTTVQDGYPHASSEHAGESALKRAFLLDLAKAIDRMDLLPSIESNDPPPF